MTSLERCGRDAPATPPSRAARGGGAAAAAPGLVSTQTSGPAVDLIQVDPVRLRLKRMKCRVLTGARLHVSQVALWRVAFITLTYAPECTWHKRHISECLRCMRRWLKRQGEPRLRYVWVAEMQRRGVIHYHLMIWLRDGIKLPFADKIGWWPHGMTKTEWARDAVGYVAKYASKGDSGPRLPKGARMYGVGGLTGLALDEARWWSLPSWLRELVVPGTRLRPSKGGGWADQATGELYRSPWRVLFQGGVVFITRAPRVV